MYLSAVTLALLAAPAAAPPPPPPPRDDLLFETLKGVINRGADLYNGGEPAACYYLYQGSLMTIKPSLDRYPELQKAVTKALAGAERDPVMWRRAFTLRDALDKVRAGVNPNRSRERPKADEADKLKMPKTDEKKDPDKDAG